MPDAAGHEGDRRLVIVRLSSSFLPLPSPCLVFRIPPSLAKEDMDGYLVAVVAMAVAGVLLHLIRLVGRLYFKIKLDISDLLAGISILIFSVFLCVVPFVLQWGTNNISPALRDSLDPESDEVRRRVVGSKLLIIDRLVYILSYVSTLIQPPRSLHSSFGRPSVSLLSAVRSVRCTDLTRRYEAYGCLRGWY